MWQQQMRLMESFHNDMIMMVQMFFAMHREHMASVREELDRVEQLTRELTLCKPGFESRLIRRPPVRPLEPLDLPRVYRLITPRIAPSGPSLGNRTPRPIDVNRVHPNRRRSLPRQSRRRDRMGRASLTGATPCPVDQTHHGTPA